MRDHQRIVFLSTRVDFPFDTTRALELALFRTFGVPSISALLHRTGELERRAQKRYDDTDIIVSEMIEHGYDKERGGAALAHEHDPRPLQDRERGLPLRALHVRVRADPLQRALRLARADYEARRYRFTEANRAVGAATVALRVLPRRRHPSLRTAMMHPTYPKGYEIETLGP